MGVLLLSASATYAACVAEVPVTVTSITPAGGNASGGYSVNINGHDLANTTSVTFGGVNAPITSTTATKLIVTAPAKPGGGTVQVKLFGNYGEITSGATCTPKTEYVPSPSPLDQFTYVVTSITIASSPVLLAQVGTPYTQTNVASGGNGNYTYSFSGTLPSGTSLNMSTGTVSGTPTATGSFSYTITATDSPASTPVTTPAIAGTVVPAGLAIAATPSATTQVGQSYSQANVATDGAGSYVYSLSNGTLPPGTSLNTSTGLVSGTPTTAGFFSYTIKVTDANTDTASASTGITITNAAISLNSTASVQTQVAQPYSQANTASGGTPNYFYTLNGGALPAGTSLNPNTGVVSGTPTIAGAFSYSILATDSTGGTASNTVSGTISGPGFALTSTPSALTQVGQPYSQTNVGNFGTTPYTYAVTAGSLPVGTTLNTSTGTVSGTPTAAGPFSYTITATDSSAGPATASRVISGTISSSTLTITVTPSAQTKIGQPYLQTNVASGGTPTYTYTLYAGALPVGTSLNPTTGTVSGTPSVAGVFYYSILVTDSGVPAQTATSIAIAGVIATATSTVTLTSSANPSPLGEPVTFTATVPAGATGTVTFKDGGTTIGTAAVVGTTASLTTSSLNLGDHSITATYGGNASFAASTSTALIQTISAPSSSLNLRAMQILATQAAASMSSQAISGALENAISDGFDEGGGALTPNGSGFTLNFAAVARKNAGGADRGNLENFVASPDGSKNRVDDGFSALGYQSRRPVARGTTARAQAVTPQSEWLPWLDVRGVSIDRRSTGSDLRGTQMNVLIGLTHKFSPDFLIGVFGGYERGDFNSDALTGHLKGSGWTYGGYLGWKFDQYGRFDIAVARSDIGYDASAGTASATFPGVRWLVSSGLTGNIRMQGFIMEPSLRAYAMWEREAAYTDSFGVTQTERNFSSGRASAGDKLSYPIKVSSTFTATPYVGIYGDYYFSRDDASSLAGSPALLMQGFSARLTGGVGMNVGGAVLSAGGEYGGIGGSTQLWTWRARGTLPF